MIFRRLDLYSFKLHEPIPSILPKGDFRILFLEHRIPELANIFSESLIDSRFSCGQMCCCALQGSRIVAYCWVSSTSQSVGEVERIFRPGDGEIYLFDAFTSAPHRGRDLFPAILCHTLNWARSEGYSRALIFALSYNRASIRAITKAGFRLFRIVTFVSAFGRTLCLYGRQTAREETVRLERESALLKGSPCNT